MSKFMFYINEELFNHIAASCLPLLNKDYPNYEVNKIEFQKESNNYGWMTIEIDERGLFWLGFLTGKRSCIHKLSNQPKSAKELYEEAVKSENILK